MSPEGWGFPRCPRAMAVVHPGIHTHIHTYILFMFNQTNLLVIMFLDCSRKPELTYEKHFTAGLYAANNSGSAVGDDFFFFLFLLS